MKLKYSLFTLFVSLFVSVAAFGQSSKVLVPGDPALTQADADAVVMYYERGLDVSFSAGERQRLQSLIVDTWRGAQKEGSAAKLGDLLKTVNALNGWDDAKRAKLQDKLREAVTADLEATANAGNEMSRYVLEVYQGRGGASPAADRQTAETPAAASTGFAGNISAIAGDWVWGSSGSSTYSAGGSLLGSNGSRFTYKFLANGSVQYTGIMNVMTAGCRMQVFSAKTGRASLSGDTLTINWSPADFSRDDSCSPAKNYKKKLPAETETYRVRFNDSYGQRQLCLTGKDETCFSPAN